MKDNTGEPLPGVTVLAEGTQTASVTNNNGEFSLSVSPTGTLVFTYLGYATQTVPVNGATSHNITMVPSEQYVDEIVVVAYGQQRKVTITGAVSNIGGTELMKSPVASLGNSLSGKLPGVSTVQYSGLPGADAPTIRVRGIGTLNSADPLILVDGVERSFTQIDPNEVADISILKDAAATAVYGVRGANGVIIVTTKRGGVGRTNISISSSVGVNVPTKFLEFANSYDYATFVNNAQMSDNPNLTPADLKFSEQALRHFRDHDQPILYPDTNWIDYIMKDAAVQSQHNINISGGNERARYFTSVGILTQNGLFETFSEDKNTNFNYRRYNYRANLDVNLTKWSTISVNMGGRFQDRNDIGGGTDNLFRYLMDAPPMAGPGIVDGKRILSNKMLVGNYSRDGLDTFYARGYTKFLENVLNLDLVYNMKLDFITQGLSFKIQGSYNSNYTKQKQRTSGGKPTYTPIILEQDANGEVLSYGLQKSGDTWNLGYEERATFGRDWYMEGAFNYSRKFGRHDVTGLVLYNQSKRYYPRTYEDLPSGYVGLVARATYNYDQRYLLDLNMGYNGSENFARDKRYGLFPSMSVGWIPTAEKFMQNQKVVSYMKFRYSYGLVGNDGGGSRFLYLPGAYVISNPTRRQDRGYNFGTNQEIYLPRAYESTTGNPDVTWETATKQNIGLDLRTLDSRLGVTVDYFWERRRDILINNRDFLPATTAQKATTINYGKVNNHGYEIVLDWEDRPSNDFRYSVEASVFFARNKIIEMAEIPKNYPWLYRTGHPVNQPFGYEFFGFYNGQETDDAYQAKYGTAIPTQIVSNIKPGDSIYVDLNGDGKIDGDDQHAIGFTNIPEYNFSLNASVSWRGFDFSMLWIGSTNVSRELGDIYRPQTGQQNTSALLQWVFENSWTPETAKTAILPRMTFDNVKQNADAAAQSSVWFVDTSYARLKNVEIGYTFDNISFMRSINSLRVYANGYNLLTFSRFTGNDPENTGGTYNNFIRYPLTKIFNLGVRINF